MPAEAPGRWTTPADLRAVSKKAWDRGALLREVLEPTGAYPRRRALKKPTAAELRDHYPAARQWAGELTATAGAYDVEFVELGSTTIGANQVPAAVVFATVDDEIAFVGRTGDARAAVELAQQLTDLDPALRAWAVARPLRLVESGEDALTAARVAVWLREHPDPGIHVRQLGLPGVHTKFVEGHRRTIDEMLTALQAGRPDPDPATAAPDERLTALHAGRPDPDPSTTPYDALPVLARRTAGRTPAARFAARHGFLQAPERVRFRLLDPRLEVLGGARDITVTAEAFAALDLPVERVVVTENLVNFLALPDSAGTLALFGEGYGFSALQDAAWLQSCRVDYWGDLDTHGFRILDQLRSLHPHVDSVLMDEETLLEHRDRWDVEPSPSRAVLTRLTAEESVVYDALRDDRHGPSVRLEQELIRWQWALDRLLL
ncbi:hypothetical protein E8P82_07865 [Arthrobacter echini]|uniref:DUF3322 and DUF2220 domain-containing protein n=1 Tax=Arthrobacter echini TaxID=1529066 RepID=A0A4S5E5N8_9MICC|nr:Wadjet anti-phage system protein JetD domain-containing protein [Arthrobacter echini]THJ66831.1 hypothetical protein E8P82_07865 [Arthrobacter echini]